MQKKQILIAGGYGSVGSHISALFSKNDKIIPVISGRSRKIMKELLK